MFEQEQEQEIERSWKFQAHLRVLDSEFLDSRVLPSELLLEVGDLRVEVKRVK